MGKIADFILGHDFDMKQPIKDLCQDAWVAAQEALKEVRALASNVRAQGSGLLAAEDRITKLEEANRMAKRDLEVLAARILNPLPPRLEPRVAALEALAARCAPKPAPQVPPRVEYLENTDTILVRTPTMPWVMTRRKAMDIADEIYREAGKF